MATWNWLQARYSLILQFCVQRSANDNFWLQKTPKMIEI